MINLSVDKITKAMHSSTFSRYHESSVASAKLKTFQFEHLPTERKLSITLMENVKPNVMEKHEFEKR